MKRFAKTEDNPIAEIPAIVGIDPIAVQSQLAGGRGTQRRKRSDYHRSQLMCAISSVTPPLEYSQG